MNDVVEVFEFWKQCARHPRSCLDEKRARLIRKALKWGYSVADLKLAILGITTHGWNNGQNPSGGTYTDLGLLLRDGDHVDRFMRHGAAALSQAFYEARKEHERREEEKRRTREIPAEARAKIATLAAFRPRSTPR